MVQIDENEDFSNMIIKTKVHMKCAIKILTEEFCSDGSIFYLCSLGSRCILKIGPLWL